MKLIAEAVSTVISQYKRGRATGERRANSFGYFRKRTITPLEFVSEMASIAAEASTFHKVWIKRELDPRFRETLMLAVARFNESKYCSWAHHEWANIEGVNEKELTHVEHMDPAQFDRKTWLAISFACELITARFGPVSKKLMRKMRAHYTAEEIEEITLVAKVMDALNRSSNTFDALVSRLGGKPSRDDRIVDEVIMSAVFCCAVPLLLAFFSRSSNRSIGELVRRMSDYTEKMDAECMDAERRRKRPAQARKRPAQARGQAAKVRMQPAH